MCAATHPSRRGSVVAQLRRPLAVWGASEGARSKNQQRDQPDDRQQPAAGPDVEHEVMWLSNLFARLGGLVSQIVLAKIARPRPQQRILTNDVPGSAPVLQAIRD